MTHNIATVVNSLSSANDEVVRTPTDLQEIIDNLGVTEIRVLTGLAPSRKNLRKLSKKKLAKLVASISYYGVVMPIPITPNGEIVAGEARVEAAKVLGLDRVRVWLRRTLLRRRCAPTASRTTSLPKASGIATRSRSS